MAKEIVYGKEAQDKILSGVEKIRKIVGGTLGPKGRNVIFTYGRGSNPTITKDGVTVANQITLSDEIESQAVEVIKLVSRESNKNVGDGTTSSTILACELVQQGIKAINEEGAHPVMLKRGMDKAVEDAKVILKKISRKSKSKTKLHNIAMVSSNGDEKIAKVVTEAFMAVGENGTVSVASGHSLGMSVDVSSGMRLEQGLFSPYFITNLDNAQCEYKNALVLVSADPIDSQKEIFDVAQMAATDKMPLVIIAPEIRSDVLGFLLQNRKNGTLDSVAVRAPRLGTIDVMHDIAAYVGTELISGDNGNPIQNMVFEKLGFISEISVGIDSTIMKLSDDQKKRAESRIKELKELHAKTDIDADKAELKTRIGALSGNVATIRVAMKTEVEESEALDRVEDAVCAVQAAMEEGYVVGGGSAYMYIGKALSCNKDQDLGYYMVANSLDSIFDTLLSNSGLDAEPFDEIYSQVLSEMYDQEKPSYGYNFREDQLGDLVEMGIIDPTKVVRTAIENAVSAAGVLLTTEAIIINEKENE